MMARLPNIAGLGAVLVFSPIIFRSGSVKKILSSALLFFTGFSIAVLSCMVIINHLGQTDSVFESFSAIMNPPPRATPGTHSLSNLSKNLFKVTVCSIGFGFFFLFFIFLTRRIKKSGSPRTNLGKILLFGASCQFVFFLNYPYFYFPFFWWHVFLPGLLYLTIFEGAWKNPPKREFLFLALFLLVLPQLGSNTNIRNAIYGMWLAIPFFITTLFSEHRGLSGWLRGFRLPLLTGLFLYAAFSSLHGPFDDRHWRWEMTHSIDHPKMAWTFTSKARAERFNDLLKEVKKWSHLRYALCLNRIPIVFYLTDFLPYIGAFWVEILPDQNEVLEKGLKENTKKEPPLIIRAKIETQGLWPEETFLPVDENPEREKILKDFINRHGYRKSWENEMFEIYATIKMELIRTKQ